MECQFNWRDKCRTRDTDNNYKRSCKNAKTDGTACCKPLGGKLVLSKVKFNGDYSDSVAVDNQDNPRYIITLRSKVNHGSSADH